MIIAMTAAGMVQMPFHQVINVITVRHGFVTTASSMLVIAVVAAAIVIRCAIGSISATNAQRMIVHMIAMYVVEVTVMKIVFMAIMLDGLVTTTFTVFMVMSFMFASATHLKSPENENQYYIFELCFLKTIMLFKTKHLQKPPPCGSTDIDTLPKEVCQHRQRHHSCHHR